MYWSVLAELIKNSQVQNRYVLRSIDIHCYPKPQYGQIRAKHIYSHWIRANTYQNTGKYVHNTYQYHRCSPQTCVLRWSWIHTKTYQIHTNSYKYTQKYIPIRVHLSTCGGNLAVVLVCIVACIDVYLHANISWYIPILLHDRTGGIGMYWYMYLVCICSYRCTCFTNTCQYIPLQPATSGRAAACAQAGPRFHWGFCCMSHTVGNTSAWLWGHLHAQGDSQRALSCFEGRSPIRRGRSVPQLGATPPWAGQIRLQWSQQRWEHAGNSVGPAGRAEQR